MLGHLKMGWVFVFGNDIVVPSREFGMVWVWVWVWTKSVKDNSPSQVFMDEDVENIQVESSHIFGRNIYK